MVQEVRGRAQSSLPTELARLPIVDLLPGAVLQGAFLAAMTMKPKSLQDTEKG